MVLGHRTDFFRCAGSDDVTAAIAALREAMAAPQPEPVALESVHLTRDTRGMCVVRVNGRVAIRDNGDIIDHMATLEWFAAPPAAPALPAASSSARVPPPPAPVSAAAAGAAALARRPAAGAVGQKARGERGGQRRA